MKSIITFISQFSNFFDPNKTADEYTFPGGKVYGRQTNEAPVKYLLQQDPDIDWIICICTKAALNEKKHNVTAYQYFQNNVLDEFPNVLLMPVHFFEDNFEEEVIPEILNYIGPNDEIYLDTTGGPRNAISQLILLAQVLGYQGTKLLCAVYSNYQTKKIEDVTNTYQVFDLITGLNEFRHYCSTMLLEKYYQKSELAPLIQAMKDLSECIILCRTRTSLLERRIANFNQVIQRTKKTQDPMLQVLIPIFEDKFSSMQTIPDIIRWCLNNNMILQALTIYNDCIPEYMIKSRRILDIPEGLPKRCGTKPPYMYALTDLDNGFFSLGKKLYTDNELKDHVPQNRWKSEFLTDDSVRIDYGVWLIHNLNKNIDEFSKLGSCLIENGFHVNISREKMQAFCLNYMYINLLRNQLNHDGGEMLGQKSRIWYMTARQDRRPLERIDIQYVKEFVGQALDQLKEC